MFLVSLPKYVNVEGLVDIIWIPFFITFGFYFNFFWWKWIVLKDFIYNFHFFGHGISNYSTYKKFIVDFVFIEDNYTCVSWFSAYDET
jgi:hypothetical protein